VVPDLPPQNGELNIILGQPENGSQIPGMKNTDRYIKNSAVYLSLYRGSLLEPNIDGE
jgi:hypothetical protein